MTYPSKKMGMSKKIVLGIIISIVGFFAIGLGGVVIWSTVDPEGYEESREQRELEIQMREKLEQQKILRQQIIDKAALEGKGFPFDDGTLQEFKEFSDAKIELMEQLPQSCKGVNSMELEIYSTGKKCFAALNDRVEQWCFNEKNRNEVLAKDCVTQFYLKLADTCENPAIGSVDVCLMYTFKELYPKLIP